ncbi:MAG: hypothetical protein HC831_25265 [Chloroflexia bacterium]|nr:hypothetical protein [Chloroflexia bacterium]
MKKDSDISVIDLLIGKYLSGNASKEETEEFLTWLESSSQNREYYAQSLLLWLQSKKESVEASKKQMGAVANQTSGKGRIKKEGYPDYS